MCRLRVCTLGNRWATHSIILFVFITMFYICLMENVTMDTIAMVTVTMLCPLHITLIWEDIVSQLRHVKSFFWPARHPNIYFGHCGLMNSSNTSGTRRPTSWHILPHQKFPTMLVCLKGCWGDLVGMLGTLSYSCYWWLAHLTVSRTTVVRCRGMFLAASKNTSTSL